MPRLNNRKPSLRMPRRLVCAGLSTALLTQAACQTAAPVEAPAVRKHALIADTGNTPPILPTELELSAAEASRKVFVAAAVGQDDTRLDLLAGAVHELLVSAGNGASVSALLADIETMARHIDDAAPPAGAERSVTNGRALSQAMTQVVETLPGGRPGQALRALTRGYFDMKRESLDAFRSTASTRASFDQVATIERYRQSLWEQIHDLTQSDALAEEVVARSVLATRLGFNPSDPTLDILDVVRLGEIEVFVRDHIRDDGRVVTTKWELEQMMTAVSTAAIGTVREYTEMLGELAEAEDAYLEAVRPNGLPTEQTGQEEDEEEDDDRPGPVFPILKPIFKLKATPLAPAGGSFASDLGASVNGLSFQGSSAFAAPTLAIVADDSEQADESENGSEEETREDKVEEAKTELEKAIESVGKKHDDLEGAANKVLKRLGALEFVGEFIGKYDESAGRDIEQFSKVLRSAVSNFKKYTESALDAAEFIADLTDASAVAFKVMSAVAVTGAVAAVVFGIAKLMGGGPGQPPIEQVILEEVRRLRDLVKDVQQQMHDRFDRVDRRLNRIHADMRAQFENMDFDIGRIQTDVTDMQKSLYSTQARLDRLGRDMYAFAATNAALEFVDAMTNYLGFDEFNRFPIEEHQFTGARDRFFAWATEHSKNNIQAGPPSRQVGDLHVLQEIQQFPVATNINYLGEQAGRLANIGFGGRVANPMDWLVGAQAYAQLFEEQPQCLDTTLAAQATAVADVGEETRDALATLPDNRLVDALEARYRTHFGQLRDEVAAELEHFESEPELGLHDTSLFGGPDQLPGKHLLSRTRQLGFCGGNGNFRVDVRFPLDDSDEAYAELAPYLMAGNLLDDPEDPRQQLEACVKPTFLEIERRVTELGTIRTFTVLGEVHVQFRGESVLVHRFDTETRSYVLDNKNDPISDPAERFSASSILVGKLRHEQRVLPLDSLKKRLPDLRPAQQDALQTARALVALRLDELQQDFYAAVADGMEATSSDLAKAATRLDGTRALWEAFVVLTLPISVETNDLLRELLFGRDSLLSARDLGENDGELNDVQTIFDTFSEPGRGRPAANIIVQAEALMEERLGRFASLLREIHNELDARGERETDDLFNEALARLRLLERELEEVDPADVGEQGCQLGTQPVNLGLSLLPIAVLNP